MNLGIPSMPVLVMSVLAMSACKKDNEDVLTPSGPAANEEEVITKVEITFTDQETVTEVFHMSVRFDDGGGIAERITDTLPAQRAFNVSLRLINASVDPAVDLTGEVRNEGTEHQVFFQVSNSDLTLVYADADANGKPIGLNSTAITGVAGENGELRITLRHQPDKSASGVEAGDITNAGGETDVEVTFPVTIE